MIENKQKLDWKPALQVFGQVSTWVVVPVVLALIAGKALDAHFGTDPWMFLGLTGIAFLFSIYGIVRVVKRYLIAIQPPESLLTGGTRNSPSPDKGRAREGLNQK